MRLVDNPVLVGRWLRQELAAQEASAGVTCADVARAVSDGFIEYFGRWCALGDGDRAQRRARLALLLEHQARTGGSDLDWLAATLGRELAGTGFAHAHRHGIEQHAFAGPSRYGDHPYFVAYWLFTLDEHAWAREHGPMGQAVSDRFLAEHAAWYHARDCDPEQRRALFTAWLARFPQETGNFTGERTDVHMALGEELAGTAYAHARAADIEQCFPGRRVMSGERVAYLRGMSLGSALMDTNLADAMRAFVWD